MTSGQEMQRVYSYNPGDCTGQDEVRNDILEPLDYAPRQDTM